jgi:hypothetical protein
MNKERYGKERSRKLVISTLAFRSPAQVRA